MVVVVVRRRKRWRCLGVGVMKDVVEVLVLVVGKER